jgi:hypothetical protein
MYYTFVHILQRRKEKEILEFSRIREFCAARAARKSAQLITFQRFGDFRERRLVFRVETVLFTSRVGRRVPELLAIVGRNSQHGTKPLA